MKIYRVKNWQATYENNRSRELQSLSWVLIPNSTDTDSYLTLVDRDRGASFFGVWVGIIKIASKAPGKRDGSLIRDSGQPHDATSLARMMRFPQPLVEEVLEVLTGECGLVEIADPHEGAAIPHEGAAIPHEGATNGTERNERTNGIIEKGTEQKRTNEDRSSPRACAGNKGKTVNLTLVDKTPPVSREQSLENRLIEVLGKDEVVNYRSRWLEKADQDLAKLEKVLADTHSAWKERRIKTTAAKYAEDLWKRLPATNSK